MQKDETKFRIVVWVWVLLLGVWLPSVRADERVSAISPEATAQVGVVLRCSDAALEGENEKSGATGLNVGWK